MGNTVLTAAGDPLVGLLALKENAITAGTTAQYIQGNKTLANFDLKVNAALISSDYFTTFNGKIVVGDWMVDGFSKAQTQLDRMRLSSYTVATLPAGTVGDTAFVTDATAPLYLTALTGGGAVCCPVFRNATVWVSA